MALTLIGHYDLPFVRRVGISLTILGMPFERKLLSVFSNADALRVYAPIGRVPVLVLEDGEALIDSAAILDYLDDVAGPDHALLPARGAERRKALQLMAFATGASDKAIAIVYERRRTAAKIDEDWVARCRSQLDRALVEIERRLAAASHLPDPRKQPGITVATMLGYLRLKVDEAVPVERFPQLDALSAVAEAEPAYMANLPTLAEIGGNGGAGPFRPFALAGRCPCSLRHRRNVRYGTAARAAQPWSGSLGRCARRGIPRRANGNPARGRRRCWTPCSICWPRAAMP